MKLFRRENNADADVYKRLLDRSDDSLVQEIAQVQQEIEDAYNNFQNASDPDLIDCYIFRGNAAWKRYQFLLRQAKMG
ncbi:DUF2508 family protein [Lachnospiraceae bacterium KGMB03038]|nr:DUF2508 family protein [Lachnospiraceae bacterium KGMB03038]